MVNALLQRAPNQVPEADRSIGDITWGRWPVSDGRQFYQSRAFEAPVAEPYVKLMAMYQASGQVHYTHEIDLPAIGVNAAFVQSLRALADYFFIVSDQQEQASPSALRAHLSARFESFVDLVTHEELPPGGINDQGMGADQPLFAVERVSYVGQAIALVLADTEQEAIQIADYVTQHCIGYRPIDWPAPWNEPVLSLDRAIEIGSIFPDNPESASFVTHIWKITRPGSRFDWISPDKNPLDKAIENREGSVDGVPCQIVESTQTTGSQVHFYMETQACVAIPADGGHLTIHPSSQSPMEMHQTTTMALAVEYNQIDISVRQLGGASGQAHLRMV